MRLKQHVQASRYAKIIAPLAEEHDLLTTYWRIVPANDDEGVTFSVIKARIASVKVFLDRHFAHEENVMRAIDFPAYVRHKAEHLKMLEAFWDLLTHIPSSSARWPHALTFLREWSDDHLRTFDRDLETFLAALQSGEPNLTR